MSTGTHDYSHAPHRLLTLLSSTDAAIFAHDLAVKPRFTFVAGSAAAVLGLDPNELLESPDTLYQRVATEDRDLLRRHEQDVLTLGASTVEFRLKNEQERVVWVRDSRNLIYDDNGQPSEVVGFWIDITEERTAENTLRQQVAFKQAILKAAPYAILTTDCNGIIQSVNPAVTTMLGYAPDELVGVQPLTALYTIEELDVHAQQVSAALGYTIEAGFEALTALVDNGETEIDQWSMRTADGRLLHAIVSLSQVTDAAGDHLGYLSIIQDDTERRQLQAQNDHQIRQLGEARLLLEEQQVELQQKNAELERLATTDSLTGLLNRRAFMTKVRQTLAHADRYGHHVSVILMDVDHFKAYNDSFGHLAGDAVLRQFAEVIWRTIRETDAACRYGGEEFIVLLPETDPDGAVSLAERLRKAIQSESWPHRSITASLGVSTRLAMENDVQLISRADRALYESKAAGRNRVTLHEPKAA
jgi:diguanylate cyclase (GGDEF)-like protein/PAS domain S-box-containing protein